MLGPVQSSPFGPVPGSVIFYLSVSTPTIENTLNKQHNISVYLEKQLESGDVFI